MRIFVSVSAKAPKTTGEYLTDLNKSVKLYFKKAKQFDSQYKDILADCTSLAKRFAGERHGDSRSTVEIFEGLLDKKTGKLRYAGVDDKDHYDSIDPELSRIADQAFKKILDIVKNSTVSVSDWENWELAHALASMCTRIYSKIDPVSSKQDLKKFGMFVHALKESGINL